MTRISPTHLSQLCLILAALLSVAACGGGEPEVVQPTSSANTAGGSQDDVIPSPPKPWDEMTFAEQQGWMAAEVLPRVGPMFESFDGERFAGFSCDGCHGASMQERGFEMPNPDILALHPTGSDEQHQMVQAHPQMVRFMFNQVLPTMQKLLGAEDFDVETQEGFSCYACHPSAVASNDAH